MLKVSIAIGDNEATEIIFDGSWDEGSIVNALRPFIKRSVMVDNKNICLQNNEEFQIINTEVGGRVRAANRNGKGITGNYLAIIEAFVELGGSIEKASDLAEPLTKNPRYKSKTDSTTLRSILSALVELKFLHKVGNSGTRELTSLGQDFINEVKKMQGKS